MVICDSVFLHSRIQGFFCHRAHLKYSKKKKKKQLGKVKYLGTIQLDTLLAGFCKASLEVAFFFLGSDWLYPQERL